MCGITGWVSFTRTLEGQDATANAMNETLWSRGPDAGGIWLDKNVFLGHRRLSVIDLEGGVQPMPLDDDSGTKAMISYNGEIYNYLDLREELQAKGHKFLTESDTEVILAAYSEWGEAFPEHLNGMFAVAIWDQNIDTLFLARDQMGIKPLYYYNLENGDFLFGSVPKAILAHPEANAIIDRDGLSEIFSIVKTPGHGIFQGMYELKPGAMMKLNKDGMSIKQYWELTARPHEDDQETTIAHVRDLLTDIVERQVISDVPLGTLLSGGLDSSALTVLAAHAKKKTGAKEPLKAFSIDFEGYEDKFAANVQWEDPDTPFAIEVAKHVNAEHINVMLNNDDVMNTETRDATLKCQDLPISTGDMEYSLYLLCEAVRKQVTVAISGESSDELFGGYTWFHDEDAVSLNSFPWHHPFEKAGGIGALKTLGIWESLDLDGYVKTRFDEALEEMPRLEGESEKEARMRQISYLNITRWENFLLDRSDRISGAVGLEIRVPFCDHRLVDYVFNTPWAIKNFDGREKSLLRAAMRGLVPDSVLDRKKSPYPSTQDDGYEVALRKRVESILAPDEPVQQIVPASSIQKMLDEPVGTYVVGGPWSARSVLERLVEFNAWVKDYNVEIRLGN